MMGKTVIIDYGAGNLMSVTNALKYLGQESVITSDIAEIERADRIILPGVGAFPPAIKMIRDQGLEDVIKAQTVRKPFLGICLGMQMLFDDSDETQLTTGLGMIHGHVSRIKTDLKLPHIGWNSLQFHNQSPLLEGIDQGAYVYFVHSFAAYVDNEADLIASCDYGGQVTAMVGTDHVFGCQFHPEKSGDVGLKMLKNFCRL